MWVAPEQRAQIRKPGSLAAACPALAQLRPLAHPPGGGSLTSGTDHGPRATGHGPRATGHGPRATIHGARLSFHPHAHAHAFASRPSLQPCDQPREHGRFSACQRLQPLEVGSGADLHGEQQVTGGRHLPGLAPALAEALALERSASAIRPFGQEQDDVRGRAQEVIGDVAVATRDLGGDLVREYRQLTRDAVRVEPFVRKCPCCTGLLAGWWVGVRVRVRV